MSGRVVGWHQVTSEEPQQPRLKPILGLGFGLEVPWEREREGRTKSGTYDKLVAAAAAAAEIAFTVDHSATLCRSPHSGSTY